MPARSMGLNEALILPGVEAGISQHEALGLRKLDCMEHGADREGARALEMRSVVRKRVAAGQNPA